MLYNIHPAAECLKVDLLDEFKDFYNPDYDYENESDEDSWYGFKANWKEHLHYYGGLQRSRRIFKETYLK